MTRIFQINEGITHIEDLGLDQFLKVVDNLTKYDASEKMDGAELVIGIDDAGKLYTTRDMKGSKAGLIYNSRDYMSNGGGPTFATAHEAVLKASKEFHRAMKSGEAVEVEVLFGRQPNAIVYGLDGLNYITFLRAVPGTSSEEPRKDLPELLAKALKGQQVSVTTKLPESDDGVTIRHTDTTTNWKFQGVQKIDKKAIEEVNIKDELSKLKEYLEKTNEVAEKEGLPMSNFEVSAINLTKIPTAQRPELKKERDQVNSRILSDFKLPIKEKLLKDLNKKVKPALQGSVGDDEVGDVEGVVFVDPETHETFKLVDKETFTSINQFNYSVRKKLSGIVRSVDKDATLEARGGIVGVLRYRIMSLLGIPEATRTFTLKKILSQFDGDTPEETIEKFASNFKEINHNAYRQKISAMIKATISEIEDALKDFKANNKSYKLKLKDGKEIGYTDEIVKRTLLAFAEIRERLETYKKKVDETRSTQELIQAIVGNAAEQIHESVTLTESNEPTVSSLLWLSRLDLHELTKVYIFNYIAALILLRLKDRRAMSAIRDYAHSGLNKMGKSYLNQLGYIIFHPAQAKQYLKKGVQSHLEKIGGRILTDRRKKIHGPISSSQNGALDWSQVDDNLRLLGMRLEVYDDLIPLARAVLVDWNSATLDDKNALLSKAFYRIQGADSSSPYTGFLRNAMNHFLTHANEENEMLIKEIAQLTAERESLLEDGDGGGAAPGAGAGSVPASGAETQPAQGGLAQLMGKTTSASIAPYPTRLFKGKIIRRIPRKIEKRKKFAKTKSSII